MWLQTGADVTPVYSQIEIRNSLEIVSNPLKITSMFDAATICLLGFYGQNPVQKCCTKGGRLNFAVEQLPWSQRLHINPGIVCG